MNEFETDVIGKLATLEERTQDLAVIRADVATIKGRIRLLEFKASVFGIVGAGILTAAKALFGRV